MGRVGSSLRARFLWGLRYQVVCRKSCHGGGSWNNVTVSSASSHVQVHELVGFLRVFSMLRDEKIKWWLLIQRKFCLTTSIAYVFHPTGLDKERSGNLASSLGADAQARVTVAEVFSFEWPAVPVVIFPSNGGNLNWKINVNVMMLVPNKLYCQYNLPQEDQREGLIFSEGFQAHRQPLKHHFRCLPKIKHFRRYEMYHC